MEQADLLVVAMAERCKALIEGAKSIDAGLPQALHPNHLIWMCERIGEQAEEWPVTKLHRWIGFVQCGMLANRILDFGGAKAMFDDVQKAYGGSGEDEDLLDHLDPGNSFKVDIGGEG